MKRVGICFSPDACHELLVQGLFYVANQREPDASITFCMPESLIRGFEEVSRGKILSFLKASKAETRLVSVRFLNELEVLDLRHYALHLNLSEVPHTNYVYSDEGTNLWDLDEILIFSENRKYSAVHHSRKLLRVDHQCKYPNFSKRSSMDVLSQVYRPFEIDDKIPSSILFLESLKSELKFN